MARNLQKLNDAVKTNTSYKQTAPGPIQVQSTDNVLHYKVWLSTPPLSAEAIKNLSSVTLTTTASHQGFVDDKGAGTWSWFDIAILDSPGASKAKKIMDVSLIWLSHTNGVDQTGPETKSGIVFDRDSDLLQMLKPGNSIGVMVSSRFAGWENNAEDGFLELSFEEHARAPQPHISVTEIEEIYQRNKEMQRGIIQFYQETAVEGEKPVFSIQANDLAKARFDDVRAGSGDTPMRLLSIDGGAVRGISSLAILQELLSKVEPGAADQPWKYFDMIAGTSAGGIIALMLGRLGMSVQLSIQMFSTFSETIFKSSNILPPFYNATTLQTAVQNVVKASSTTGHDPDAPMLYTGPSSCPVFATTTLKANVTNSIATHLSTFDSKSSSSQTTLGNWKIWEAARATSAAPYYFADITVNSTQYIDGGIQSNNPSMEMLTESRSFFGYGRNIGCFVSVGTGMFPNGTMPENIYNPFKIKGNIAKLVAMITNTEATHLKVQELVNGQWPGSYFRFNYGIPTGTGDWEDIGVGFGDYKKMGPLKLATEAWLKTAPVAQQINTCAQLLKELTPS